MEKCLGLKRFFKDKNEENSNPTPDSADCNTDSNPENSNEDIEVNDEEPEEVSASKSSRPSTFSSNTIERLGQIKSIPSIPQNNRVALKSYPKSSDVRSFCPRWFSLFHWIE